MEHCASILSSARLPKNFPGQQCAFAGMTAMKFHSFASHSIGCESDLKFGALPHALPCYRRGGSSITVNNKLPGSSECHRAKAASTADSHRRCNPKFPAA